MERELRRLRDRESSIWRESSDGREGNSKKEGECSREWERKITESEREITENIQFIS